MGFGCEAYDGLGYRYCGLHDLCTSRDFDNDNCPNGYFEASEMCCDCGGGTILGNVLRISLFMISRV